MKVNASEQLALAHSPLVSASELADSPVALDWIVEPLLVAGGSMMLYGRQGMGKSRLFARLAYALATGTPWLGFPIAQPGTVAYLNLDMPEAEFSRMWRDARHASLLAPRVFVTREQLHCNILRDRDRRAMAEWLTAAGVQHLIVDTGPRAFTPSRGADMNAEIRLAISMLQGLVPHGIVAFSHHDRKRSGAQKLDDFESDPDAFSGPAAWESTVTVSARLLGVQERPRLWFKKTRLHPLPQQNFELAWRGAFLDAVETWPLDLLTWPRCLPVAERGSALSRMEVFRSIAAQHKGLTVEKVRQRYYRMRERMDLPWEATMNEEEGQ